MSRAGPAIVAALALAGLGPGAPARGQDDGLFFDAPADAVVRRTDAGNDGPLFPGATVPDLLGATLSGWLPASPGDPYAGQVVSGGAAQVFRLDVRFAGLVNPPGPLGLGGLEYDPFRYGASPVVGFLELNMDRDRDTGGQLGGAAHHRFLANAARFGCRPESSDGTHAAALGTDLDVDFFTAPQVERSGEEFSLSLCGCHPVTLVSQGGNGNGVFDAGETWVIQSRFFTRAGGYRQASGAFGGSAPGEYDPVVRLRFRHEIATNTTTITLVFALTAQGAAMLSGQAAQPLDLSVGNHVSVHEALADLVNAANGVYGPISGPASQLVDDWQGEDPTESLDPTRWRANALFGMPYAAPEPSLYAWTDLGFECLVGDMDGDAVAAALDRQAVAGVIAGHDGGPGDADGATNGSWVLPNFATNFARHDLNGDGRVNGADLALLGGPACPADFDQSGAVTTGDVSAFLGAWFAGLSGGSLQADFNGDTLLTTSDVSAFLSAWFAAAAGGC
ncbi:MAG TPA: GC-type dockerin domain-anchored protein [Phycisphaerales bacterium]|nr:GC-type dockerin domain-anchored protein [Phycisphaerales bacterium]